MQVPELALLTSTPRRLRCHLAGGVEHKGVEHQLHFSFEALQRALQRFLERPAMGSRVIAELFYHYRRSGSATAVMILYGALQTRGNTLLLARAQENPRPDDQYQNDSAQQHLLTPPRLTSGRLSRPGLLA
jgi:hypothetical protein